MTMQEAIKTGKPIHRTGWTSKRSYLTRGDEEPIAMMLTWFYDETDSISSLYEFTVEDILAEDWEIKADA